MKFVIHFHSGNKTQTDHYDFMLEQENTLSTWQINRSDMELLLKGERIKAVKTQDHRKKYLNYEGPISCDRGMVNIFDYGEYDVVDSENRNIIIKLYGEKLRGEMEIENISNDECRMFVRKLWGGDLKKNIECPILTSTFYIL